jgi:hypothetical protein
MTRREYAEELSVCLATVDNYIRSLSAQGKRVTISTLRAHQRRLTPGRDPDHQRATAIRRMRDRQRMTWSAIGDVFGFSGSRACAIYRSTP